MSVVQKEVNVVVCDGCGEEIDTLGLEQNTDWYEISVRVRIPQSTEWIRSAPIDQINQQIKSGTMETLHCHRECTIKGKMFRRVVDAMQGARQ